ncbi:MAG: CoA transferase subunit A [Proteobacteria bacterium]|nr:CoA transferase subunit A [Pseudomonadota bacterium]HQR02537.1 CoA-transferase [Rhodocyclaceae bacterium]
MNKQLSATEVVARLRDGMTIGIGGWGPRRKPMAIVREILRSNLKDLTIVAYGGPEVGMLCAAGKVRKLIFGFATMDPIPLEPYFRKAREAGTLEVFEVDEGMFEWGLRAAGMRMPFLPTRCGLATDVVKHNPHLKTIQSPYADGEVLLAMPALKLDVALIHVNEADKLGNTLITSADPLFDNLFARAADACYVSAERVVDKFALDTHAVRFNLFERYLVTGVVHAPCGAHPTYCGPDYGWDLAHLKKYNASASEESGWANYVKEFVACTETEYLAKNGGAETIGKLPMPIF